MAAVFVELPDNQLSFFLDLVTKLGYKIAESEDEMNIPEWHKEVVKDRLLNLQKEDLKNWDEIKNSFNLK
jgi:hypothetical protein